MQPIQGLKVWSHQLIPVVSPTVSFPFRAGLSPALVLSIIPSQFPKFALHASDSLVARFPRGGFLAFRAGTPALDEGKGHAHCENSPQKPVRHFSGIRVFLWKSIDVWFHALTLSCGNWYPRGRTQLGNWTVMRLFHASTAASLVS